MSKSNLVIAIIVLLIVAGGAYYLERGSSTQTPDIPVGETSTPAQSATSVPPATTQDEQIQQSATTTQEADQDQMRTTVIGTSAGGHDITAYRYGDGSKHIMFVGGIHGGYEWNTSALSYQLIDWIRNNPNAVPDNLFITVIPTLNPDGLTKVAGTTGPIGPNAVTKPVSETIPGRFNANGVDLNRNFDCNWQSQGQWRDRTVDAGSKPFSEPETKALRGYVRETQPQAVVAFYSAAGAVYTSSCNGDPSSATKNLMNTYANASGYPAKGEFDAYPITGDMTNWLAKEGIPTISVLLSNHKDVEWNKNKAGIQAVLEQYSQ